MKRLDVTEMKRRIEVMRKNAPAAAPPLDVKCRTCADHGFTQVPSADGVDRVQPCPDCRRPRPHGIPVKLQNVKLTDVRPNPGNRDALARARGFATTDRDLFLFGAVGTGKTMLAAAIANEHCAAKRGEALFVNWPLTVHQLQPGSLTEDGRRALEQRLFKVPLLVLDDLAAERDEATDFTRRLALLVFEARGIAALRTITTSNLSLDDLARHFGDERLSSRIAGQAHVVILTGTDQRLRRIHAV